MWINVSSEAESFVFSNDIVKHSGNFDGMIKAAFSAVIDRDIEFNVLETTVGSAHILDKKAPKEGDLFVIGDFIL